MCPTGEPCYFPTSGAERPLPFVIVWCPMTSLRSWSASTGPSSGIVVVAILGSLVAAVSPARGQGRERAVNVVMEDQFRNRRETGALLGDVVVLIYAERKGAEDAHELGKMLHVRFHPTAESAPATEWARQPVVGLPGWPVGARVPDVHAIPVACLPEVPKAMHPVVRARIRKESPALSVWLDFTDVMQQTFGLVPGVPNVVILDPGGRVHSVMSGRFDRVKTDELAATIDQIRMQSRPDIRTAAVPAATPRE